MKIVVMSATLDDLKFSQYFTNSPLSFVFYDFDDILFVVLMVEIK